MKNKYVVFILIGMVVLTCVVGFLSYNSGLGKEYWDGYKEGLEEGNNLAIEINDQLLYCVIGWNATLQEWKEYEDRVDYCFEKCQYDIMIVGSSDLHRICMWDCFHPDKGFVKIENGK